MATSQAPDAPGTAVAPVRKSAVARLLDNDAARSVIIPLLGRGADYGRIVQETYLAAKENPDILECTQESVVRAVAKAVSWDLVIGETVHLVPFNVKISPRGEPDQWEKRLKAMQDYKGKIELIVRSGSARSVNAECVYENDYFEMELGSDPYIRHRPETSAAKRGAMLGAYAVADLGVRFKPVIKWMTAAEILEIRAAHSKQWNKGPLQPWYARKTPVHQLAKMLPKNARLAKVLAAFDDEDAELDELQATGPVATLSPTLPDARPRTLAAAPAHAADDSAVAVQTARAADPVERGEFEREEREIDGASGDDDDDIFGAPAPATKPQHASGGPACPKCDGPCWDNRNAKRNPKSPDFKCKDRECDGVIWPPKEGEVRDAGGNRRSA